MKNSYEHLALLSSHSILAVTIVAANIDEALPGLAQMVPAPQKNRIKRLFLSPSPTHLWDNGEVPVGTVLQNILRLHLTTNHRRR
jgi:hypothetical protein